MRNAFLKNVLKLSSGTSIAYLITICISPILTRLFTPEDFGLLQYFQSSVLILGLIATGCYHFVVVSPSNKKDAYLLFKGIFLLSLLVSSLILFLLLTLYTFSELTKQFPLVVIILLPITVWFHSLNISFDYLFIRDEQYSGISFSRITRSASTGIIQTITGKLLLSLGLIYGLVVGRLAALIFYFYKTGKSTLSEIIHQPLARVAKILRTYRQQPFYILPSTLISTGSTELVVFLIAILFGQVELGFYALAFRVLSVPSAFIGSSVGDVFFKKSSQLINNSQPLLRFLMNTWGVMFLVSVIPVSLLFLFGEEIITIIFGSEWLLTGKISQILAPLILITFLSSPTGKLFISLNEQRFTPYLSVLILIGRIGGLLVGFLLGDFLFAITLMAVFHIVTLLIFNCVLIVRVHAYEKRIAHD